MGRLTRREQNLLHVLLIDKAMSHMHSNQNRQECPDIHPEKIQMSLMEEIKSITFSAFCVHRSIAILAYLKKKERLCRFFVKKKDKKKPLIEKERNMKKEKNTSIKNEDCTD